jgi:hypothetical protein
MQRPPGASQLPSLATLELELGMSNHMHSSGWARNDTLRVIGILLPPCSARAQEAGGEQLRDPESNSYAQLPGLDSSMESLQRPPLHATIVRVHTLCEWLTDTLDMPDVVTFVTTPQEQRNPAHAVSLALSLIPMLLMRISIPTLAADFYDPRLFVLAMLTAPATSLWLLGAQVPAALLLGLTAASCATGLGIALFGVCYPHLSAPHILA